MSLAVHVDAYSGYKANERPRHVWGGRPPQNYSTSTSVFSVISLMHRGHFAGFSKM